MTNLNHSYTLSISLSDRPDSSVHPRVLSDPLPLPTSRFMCFYRCFCYSFYVVVKHILLMAIFLLFLFFFLLWYPPASWRSRLRPRKPGKPGARQVQQPEDQPTGLAALVNQVASQDSRLPVAWYATTCQGGSCVASWWSNEPMNCARVRGIYIYIYICIHMLYIYIYICILQL